MCGVCNQVCVCCRQGVIGSLSSRPGNDTHISSSDTVEVALTGEHSCSGM